MKVSLDTKCKESVPTSTVHQAVDERKHRSARWSKLFAAQSPVTDRSKQGEFLKILLRS